MAPTHSRDQGQENKPGLSLRMDIQEVMVPGAANLPQNLCVGPGLLSPVLTAPQGPGALELPPSAQHSARQKGNSCPFAQAGGQTALGTRWITAAGSTQGTARLGVHKGDPGTHRGMAAGAGRARGAVSPQMPAGGR